MSRKTFCSAAVLLLALAPSAYAQDSASDDEDIIIVTGQFLSIDKVNAVKTPTPIINVPQSLSIVGKIQIEDQAFTNIGDITRYTPGLTNSQGEGHRDAIIIRGQQTTADFFQDGIRDDVQYFRPLYNLEQVEILRGSNALLFGRGGTGGIVNRVTKKPVLGDEFTTLNAAIDTFGAFYGAVDTNYTVNDTTGVRLNGFYEELNNHRDFFDGTRFGINPTVRFDVSPQTTIDLSYEYLDDDRVVDRGVPSRNFEGGPDVPLKGFDNTFFGSADENFTTLQAHILRGHVDHKFNEMLRGNFNVQYADYDKLYQNLYASEEVQVGADGRFDQVELDGYRDATDRQNLFFQGNLVGEFETGVIGHTVLVGVEYGNQDTSNARQDTVFEANGDDQLFIDFSDPLDIPAFAFSNASRNRASDVTTFSAYAQNQIDLTDQFKLILGGRYDSFDIAVNDLQANAEFSRKDEEISPRLGAIYKPAENVSIYASYSESFLPRSGDQFLTLDLDSESTRPQSFENREIGAKWDLHSGLSLTGAVFQLDRESYTSVDPENSEQVIVIEGSKTEGAEIQLSGKFTNKWTVNTGYTYLDGRVDRVDGSGTSGNRTRQTPKHTFSLWSQYEINDQIGIGAGATHQGSFFVREDNSVEVPAFIRFDASAYYEVSDDLRLQVNIENLLDTDYFPDAHSNDNISTGAPLNARFSIRQAF
ncbi:ligand-gated channel [Litorimonas cladophorae]|uniref:Ligand-gated channel n=1 Tax=Litorimonas cladophorae TaxID=1220491 RepID=A0A918NBI2_9PROT|nr:TonB-dependent siderophore receptor [Litorimonas cladophorae]GGX60385.1 ligand-gated channel [Litorimonas cladophorae]